MRQTEGEKMMDSVVKSWEAFDPLIEAASGFKERVKRQGWSDAAAEAMAMSYFQALIASAFGPTPGGAATS